MSRSIRVPATSIRPESGARAADMGFWARFLVGLSAATLVHEHGRRARRYHDDGLRGDWRAVGHAIRTATQRMNAVD